MGKKKAISHFKKIGENYKAEIIESIPENEELSIYHHGDSWHDLCRGPHLESSSKIGKAFKLTKVSGAYWRGDSNNEMLQRIYGTCWSSKKDLDAYLQGLFSQFNDPIILELIEQKNAVPVQEKPQTRFR